MTADWPLFFAPGTPVVALPGWQAPRLFVPARPAHLRRRHSSLYPAFKLPARLRRGALRALAGLLPTRTAPGPALLPPFLADVLPEAASFGVLMGTPGPAQKITVECRTADGRVCGYAKVGRSDAARARLRHEHAVLERLPAGLGPRALGHAALGPFDVLVVTPLAGRPAPTTWPPPPAVTAFVQRLVQPGPLYPLAGHPWARSLGEVPPPVAAALDALAGRAWPLAFQHGDFAAWNLRLTGAGRVLAFDWETATPEGFPFLDLAYLALQHGAHLYAWPPAKAARHAADALVAAGAGLRRAEAEALVRLAAYDAYRTGMALQEDLPLQQWRRRVWEEPA